MPLRTRARKGGMRYILLALAGLAGSTAPVLAASYDMDDSFRAGVERVRASIAQGDNAGALQAARTLAGTADAPLEKYAVGGLMLQAAGNVGDLRSQRIALGTMLDSGEPSPAEAIRLRAMAGTISAILGDRKDAVAQIEYANGQGYATSASQLALADARYQRKDMDGALKAMEEGFALRSKDKAAIPESWYDRAIALSYGAKKPDMVARWTQAKLFAFPSAPNWRSGIVNYIDSATPAPDQALDLYRLMAATDGVASERDWLSYAAIAAKGSAAESKAVLDAGVSAGDLDPRNAAVAKQIAAVKPKAAKSLADAAALTAKAKAGNGAAALAAADAQFAAAAYPTAVELYRTALSRGGVDAGRATTRLGIALARSGDLQGGKATLASVTDSAWVPVAGFWGVWIDRKIVRNPE